MDCDDHSKGGSSLPFIGDIIYLPAMPLPWSWHLPAAAAASGPYPALYYLPRPVSSADLAIMRRLDRLHLEFPDINLNK
jgi:hypothetical protein